MGSGSSKTKTRKPSVKIKRRFSLKRRSSVKEPSFKPRYTPTPGLRVRAISTDDDQCRPESKPKSKPESKPKPDLDPKPQPEIDPEIEPRSMPRPKPKVLEKVAGTNLDVFIEQSSRRRSLSDGQLPVSLQQLMDTQDQGHDQNQGHTQGQMVMALPARELNNVTRVGYLERRVNSEWTSAWYILKDKTLYQYAQPIDDVTQDIIQLPGYEVIPCLPAGDRHMFQLIHPDGICIELSTDGISDCDLWMEQIHLATQKLTIDSLSLDTINSMEQEEAIMRRKQLEDEARKQWQRELLRLKKQQLLREVLLQKEELTRKQVKLGKMKQPSSFEGRLPGSPPDDDSISFETDDQLLRDRAILKQRKVSLQLRVDMVQKQLQSSAVPSKPKKKFGRKRADKSVLPGGSAATSPDLEQLELEMKKLTTELERLNVQLEQIERRSGSSGQLSNSYNVGPAPRRRAEFALSSSASTESATSSTRDRSQSDLSRSFVSDPNLLHPTPVGSRLSLRLDSVFSPEGVNVPLSGNNVSPAKLRSHTSSDIPMIDQTPSPETRPIPESKSRHSWNTNNSTPYFHQAVPGSQLGLIQGSPNTMHSMAGFNKSCDFSLLQYEESNKYPHARQVQNSSGGHGTSQHTVPRSRSESSNISKFEISATALAEIAAFEELVQKKMQQSAAVQ